MTTRRFITYGGINLLLALAIASRVPDSEQPLVIAAMTFAIVTGWMMGRIQSRAGE